MVKNLRTVYARVLGAVVDVIARSGVHPNALTWISLVPAIAAGVAAAYGNFIGAALLLLLSGVFDLLDGGLARATKQESRFGALLDSSLDRLSDAAVLMGMVLFYAPHGSLPVLIPLAAITSGFIISYVRARAEGLNYDLPRLWMRREDRMAILVVGLFLAPLPLPGIATPSGFTLLVVGTLAVLGFIAAGTALLAAARRS